jgi:hypothetical protein
MTGSAWRLLAAFLLILVAALSHAQDGAAARLPPLASNPGMLRYAPVGEPGWIPPYPGTIERYPSSGYPGVYPPGRYPFVPSPIRFPQIVQAAGIIFSGHVTAVARTHSSTRPVSTAVTFKVESAIQGTFVGQTLTIHEWAGLWTRGERYRVGEHVFLFLYSPSKLGLTSPVAGGIGRFAINSGGQIVMTPQHVHILVKDPILGGKLVVPYSDFEVAVRRSSRGE